MKRLFDIAVSLIGLICLSPLLLLVPTLIKLESSGPIFFRQKRMGRYFRPFYIFKFRTMVHHTGANGSLITSAGDPRITRCGRVLRKMKIDEIPQLINVLKGDMSLVGPRPEVPQYVEAFQEDYDFILKVRPGLTDLASLKYRNEEAILSRCEDPEKAYITTILPDKINLARQYIDQSSLLFDIRLILKTVTTIASGAHAKEPVHERL
jgi:lipopolysaccharide/colanic/teichoic acid biosynthesis glycosyltransferase